MSADTDTIAALATPPGRGGIGVIRVSGADCKRIASAVIGTCPPARRAHYAAFRDGDGQAIDAGIALYFPAPHSFTGEDVLELQGHGSPAALDALLARLLALGARAARPGEFSERAFVNDKIDLAQAEAIADLIAAGSAQAARAAMRSLEGVFSKRVQALLDGLVELRVYVEAAIDFPDEEVDYLADGQVAARVDALLDALAVLRRDAGSGAALREGLQVVIIGRPNVGKSSLLNRLAARDAAIVTDIPGTTRDLLREHIHLDGLPLQVVDTAGLRASEDPVEVEGVRRARAAVEQAAHVLLLVDDRARADDAELRPSLPPDVAVTSIRNKCDLSGGTPGRVADAQGQAAYRVSATTGDGFDALVAHLKRVAGLDENQESVFLARRRHLDALERAGSALEAGRAQLTEHAASELLAEDLRAAQAALGEITGAFTSEDLLGEIFSSFCIGK